jgi:hypothetical protein
MSEWLTNHPGMDTEGEPVELCLLEEETLEMDFGWVFFYTSRLYRDSGDLKYAIAGNAPMIVDSRDGSLHVTGTAHPVGHYIEEHRRRKALEAEIPTHHQLFPCPCCGYFTIGQKPPGTFEICPVCFWEDDPVQFNDHDYDGAANTVSLKTAQANFREFGASERQFVHDVRTPMGDEIPPW